MLNNKRRYILIGSIVLLITVTALAFAVQPQLITFFKPKAVRIATPPKVFDNALLKRLDNVFKNLDFGRPAYTLSGTITVVNKEDSTENMKNVYFLISKKGGDFYYKEGETETINEEGVYIDINKQTNKVFISPQKQVNTVSIIDVDKLKNALQSEKYNLTSKVTDGMQTISMLNEYHISCKEYALTFDTLNNKINRIYTRLTDIKDPLNKSKDKIVDIKITRLDNEARLEDYNTKNKIVYKSGKNWTLTARYSGYKLIQL